MAPAALPSITDSGTVKLMFDSKLQDPFVSDAEAVEVDEETSAAIRRGLRDVEEGRLVTSDEVRKLMAQWTIKKRRPTGG